MEKNIKTGLGAAVLVIIAITVFTFVWVIDKQNGEIATQTKTSVPIKNVQEPNKPVEQSSDKTAMEKAKVGFFKDGKGYTDWKTLDAGGFLMDLPQKIAYGDPEVPEGAYGLMKNPDPDFLKPIELSVDENGNKVSKKFEYLISVSEGKGADAQPMMDVYRTPKTSSGNMMEWLKSLQRMNGNPDVMSDAKQVDEILARDAKIENFFGSEVYKFNMLEPSDSGHYLYVDNSNIYLFNLGNGSRAVEGINSNVFDYIMGTLGSGKK